VNPQQPWLKHVDVLHVREGTLGLDGVNIRNRDGEELGSVDGVLVASDTGRPVYAVVHAGGWFRSPLFLVPIGELSLAPDGDGFVVRLTREQVMRFPGFDNVALDGLSDREIRRANSAIADVFEPGVEYAVDERVTAAWLTPPYRTPEWWTSDRELSDTGKGIESPGRAATAQPGDVLGIERGGAQVHLGETPDEESERLREATDYERNRGVE
jgi:hypothetical protein